MKNKYIKFLQPYQVKALIGKLAVLTTKTGVNLVFIDGMTGNNVVRLIKVKEDSDDKSGALILRCTESGLIDPNQTMGEVYYLYSTDEYSYIFRREIELDFIRAHCLDRSNRLLADQVISNKPYYLVYNWGKLSNPKGFDVYKVIVKSKLSLMKCIEIELIHIENVTHMTEGTYRIELIKLPIGKKVSSDSCSSKWLCQIPEVNYK